MLKHFFSWVTGIGSLKCPGSSTSNTALRSRSGSAVLMALGFGIVLMIVIATLFSYSSARIQNTLMESQMLKSLAVAEAGLQMAICELYQDPAFATHDLDTNQDWTNNAKAHSNYIADVAAPLGLTITKGTNGTYEGTFGEGTFKVRVGPINASSFADNPNTKNINEETCFLRVDSMGKVKDYVKHITAIVMRRYPGREFLMYSGDVLSIVYGLKGNTFASQFNVFSTGHLYGHRGVEIGPVMQTAQGGAGTGTRQKLKDVELLSSGVGGIFFYDPQGTPILFRGDSAETTIAQNVDPAVFRDGNNFSATAKRDLGSFPTSLVDEKGNLLHKPITGYAGDKIRDKNTAMSLPPVELNFPKFKKDAQTNGKVLTGNATRQMAGDSGWPGGQEQVAVLDFGNEFHDSPDPSLSSLTKGSVLYSDSSIVIRGNPPVGLTIASAKNVFVAGDFNQKAEARGKVFPQHYTKPLEDSDYLADAETALMDDAKPTTAENQRFHQPVQVIAQERIIYDYRSPVECFENELYPLLKMQIASAVADPALGNLNQQKAMDFILLNPSNPSLQVDKALAKAAVASVVSQLYPLGDAALETTIAAAADTKIQALGGNNLDAAALDAITKDVWKEYAKRYETIENTAQNTNTFGVYKMLDDLQAKVKNAAPGTLVQHRLFVPEMTTNGMFISCAQRHAGFYAGPDEMKHFDEMGNHNNGIGIKHSGLGEFIHRLHGSEVRYAYKAVHKLSGNYTPPLRKKVYDESLPRFGVLSGLNTNAGDITQFVVISWKDLRATEAEYNAFSN